jgi:hypothetical protein
LSDQYTFVFEEPYSHDEAVVILRRSDRGIGIALSLSSDGDTELFIPGSHIDQIIDAMQRLRNEFKTSGE